MNVFVLYLVLLKATITTFAGLASLPVVRDELVVKRHVLTDAQINEAVVITRSTPGPVGLYVVSVGFFAGGFPGAVAGWLAMSTPALLIIPLLHLAGRKLEDARVKSTLQAVVVASAGLLLASTVPLAQSALVDPVTIAIALATVALMIWSKVDTLWLILGAALTTLAASAIRTATAS